MGIFEHLIGFLAVFLSLAAYAQTDKTRFLLFNSAAISAVGVNFYLHGGYVGAYTECVMLLVHLSAFFLSQRAQNRLKLLVPIFSFVLFLTVLDSGSGIFVPAAMGFFAAGVYQEDMVSNKTLFAMGLFSLFLYSASIGAYYVAFSNIFGVGVLLYARWRLVVGRGRS